MGEWKRPLDGTPKVLVKVVHGCHVDMTNDGSREAVRGGGELIRVSRTRAERLIAQGKVEAL